MDFVGIGALNLDRLYKVEKIAEGDEEVAIQEAREESGGSAANTIYALGKLGMSTGFIGAIGNDAEAKVVLGSLNSVGCDTSHIKIKANSRTGLVIGIVDPKGERALYIAAGANDLLSEDDIDFGYLDQVDFLHISSFVSDEQLDIQKRIVEKLSPETKLSFAPGSLYVKKGLSELEPIIKRTYVLFLNEVEAKELTGKEYQEASDFLMGYGCNIICITLKDRGCYVTDGKSKEHVEAIQTDVIDTTGAGDAFCAGFLFGLSQGKDLKECGRLGNLVAARCIVKIGARSGLPQLSDLK
jgi:ribokinase